MSFSFSESLCIISSIPSSTISLQYESPNAVVDFGGECFEIKVALILCKNLGGYNIRQNMSNMFNGS